MINVNYGRSVRILEACKPLQEYSWLVHEIRKNTVENNVAEDEETVGSVVDRAIESMPEDFLIKPFLEAHKAEVKGMLLTEYNEVETMELFREDGRREGRAEGLAEGRVEGKFETLIELVQKGLLSTGTAATQLGITEADFLKAMAKA